MLNYAWGSSRKSKKRKYPKNLGGENLFEHYQRNIEKGRELSLDTHVLWCEQIVESLPIVQMMYQTAKKEIKRGLMKALEEAYKAGYRRIPKAGIIADYTAVVAYILLSERDNDRII